MGERIKTRERAIFKLNNGAGALLCSGCNIIIKTGKDFTDEEKNAYYGRGHLDAQYCSKCLEIIQFNQTQNN